MPDRRFRDMSLTEQEVTRAALAYWPGPALDRTQAYGAFMARAKRLLPLWRKWGLEELQAFKPVTIDEPATSSYGWMQYKGQWHAWLRWFRAAPLQVPRDYVVTFKLSAPRKKRGTK